MTSTPDIDAALTFIQQHPGSSTSPTISPATLLQKIDRRIVPTMFLCYLIQFLDKVLINYANVMGLSRDLQLRNNEFSWLATGFFLAYLVAEIPTNYMLQKLPVGKYLGVNVILWGIATACTAACHNFHTVLLARIFLGIFEACIAPCLSLITSMWYTKAEQAPRFGIWYCGVGVGQILGGVVSFGFQNVSGTMMAGWRVMFLVLGMITVCIGLTTYVYLPDNPMTSEWLSIDERVAAIKRVMDKNQTGIENRRFRVHHVVEALMDPQYWLLFILTILCSLSSGVISTYSTTLIRNFGFGAKTSALLNMPSGVVSITSTVMSTLAIGRCGKRWLWTIFLVIPGVIGGGMMSFLPGGNKAGLLIGIYLINTIVAVMSIIYSWAAANTAGHTKKIVVNTTIMIGFSLGNIVSPMSFQAKDAPQYTPAKILVLASQAAVGFVALGLRGYYGYENRRRDVAQSTDDDSVGDRAWLNLTDCENKAFQYSY
ncbi:MFS general substrate transporter [Wilcoxina mikolae CBS 423.85]|nr:MFS general substrate transporter [Wilcoxina mikolae CBS 423.85]